MKKTIIIIGTFIVLLACVIAILVVTQPQALTVSPINAVVNQTTGTHCFAYHQLATKDAPYAVDEYLTITINGTQVTGNKKGNQSGPDMANGYTGSLTGVIEGDTITADYAYTVEDSKNKEQEIYKITPSEIDKLQYPLIDHYKDGLVPDTAKQYKIRAYAVVDCSVRQ